MDTFPSLKAAIEALPTQVRTREDIGNVRNWWQGTKPLLSSCNAAEVAEIDEIISQFKSRPRSVPPALDLFRGANLPPQVRKKIRQDDSEQAMWDLVLDQKLRFIENKLQTFLNREPPPSLRGLHEIINTLETREKKGLSDDAYQRLNEAFRETFLYLAQTKIPDSQIDPAVRERLSALWDTAASAVRHYDSDLYQVCFEKNTYWLDPSRWDEGSIRKSGFSLAQMEERVKRFGLSQSRSQRVENHHCDVAILTVIQPELDALVCTLGAENLARRKHSDGTIYLEGSVFSQLKQRQYKVALACIGSPGNPSSATAAALFLERYRPHVFILMGIAAGTRKRLKIGNVVIAERVVAYEPAAIVRKGNEEVPKVEPRPEIARIGHSITQDLLHYRAVQNRLDARFTEAGGEFPTPKRKSDKDLVANSIEVRISTAASGEKLLRDPEKLQSLRSNMHGKIEIGEMEAVGITEACRTLNISWIVVRGVSDFGDEFKDDRFHEFASRAAATVTCDFIEYGLDIES